MDTKEILEFILKNADISYDSVESPYESIKLQLRYYGEDVPKSPRFLYDSDAVYFYNCDDAISSIDDKKKRIDFAERGDIMTSLWTPLTYYLKLNNGRILSKNNSNIGRILRSFDTDKRTRDIFRLSEYLSLHYASRGNLLLLPNTVNQYTKRSLNPDKFKESEDKLDQFLYSCFDGKLRCYFYNKPENIVEWILSEHLECMFSKSFFDYSMNDIENGRVQIIEDNSSITKENIQSLIDDQKRVSSYKYQELTDTEWNIYFERLNKVIAYRNSKSVHIESHLPLEWEK